MRWSQKNKDLLFRLMPGMLLYLLMTFHETPYKDLNNMATTASTLYKRAHMHECTQEAVCPWCVLSVFCVYSKISLKKCGFLLFAIVLFVCVWIFLWVQDRSAESQVGVVARVGSDVITRQKSWGAVAINSAIMSGRVCVCVCVWGGGVSYHASLSRRAALSVMTTGSFDSIFITAPQKPYIICTHQWWKCDITDAFPPNVEVARQTSRALNASMSGMHYMHITLSDEG